MMLAQALLLAAALAAPPEAAAPPVGGIERVTFAEAVRRAMARNTSAVVAAEEIRRADGFVGEVASQSLPTLGVTGTLTRLDSDRTSGGRVILPAGQANGTGVLALPLVVPSRWAQWAHASQALDATVASDASVRRTVAITTGRTYLSIVAQRRAVEVSQLAVQTSKAHFDYAFERRRGGVGNALDVSRAELELSASQVQLEAAYVLLVRGQEALGQLCGENRPLDAADVPGLPDLPDQAQALNESESRADVKAAAASAYVASRVYKDSWTDWLPNLLGTLQGFVQDPATLTTPTQGWQAQLVLSWTLFDGWLRPSQLKERDALSKEADAQLDGVQRQARSEVRTAIEALRRSRAAYEAARRGADSAQQALDLSSQAYRAGAVDNLAVTDAEQRARNAALTAVIAEDSVRQSILDVLSAAGRFP